MIAYFLGAWQTNKLETIAEDCAIVRVFLRVAALEKEQRMHRYAFDPAA